MKHGSGLGLVACLVFKTSCGGAVLRWVGSIPTRSRQNFKREGLAEF